MRCVPAGIILALNTDISMVGKKLPIIIITQDQGHLYHILVVYYVVYLHVDWSHTFLSSKRRIIDYKFGIVTAKNEYEYLSLY